MFSKILYKLFNFNGKVCDVSHTMIFFIITEQFFKKWTQKLHIFKF